MLDKLIIAGDKTLGRIITDNNIKYWMIGLMITSYTTALILSRVLNHYSAPQIVALAIAWFPIVFGVSYAHHELG